MDAKGVALDTLDKLKKGEIVLAETGKMKPIAMISEVQAQFMIDALIESAGTVTEHFKLKPHITSNNSTISRSYFNYANIGNAYKILEVGDFVLVSEYYRLKAFTKTGEYIGQLTEWSSDDKPGLAYGINGISVSPDKTKILLPSQYSYTVEIYELYLTDDKIQLGKRIGRVGYWRENGRVIDGRLGSDVHAEWLSNENFIVYSNSEGVIDGNSVGRGSSVGLYRYTGETDPKDITDYNNANVEFIRTILNRDTTQSFTTYGECGTLRMMKKSRNKILMADNRDELAIFSYTDDDIVLDEVIPLPVDLTIERLNIYGATLMGTDKIAIIINSVDKIAILDKSSGDWVTKGIVGVSIYDNVKEPKLPVNGFWDLRDITTIDGKLLVCDYGNSRVSYVETIETVDVNYLIPEGKILFKSLNVDDLGNYTFSVTESVKDLDVLIERKITN